MRAWGQLQGRYPWPDRQPSDQGVKRPFGWLHNKTQAALRQHLGEHTRYVVELGTWLGRSARFILSCAPNAKIVCVDHWQGSPELGEDHGHLFGEPVYQAFLHHNWDLRERIVAVQDRTEAGITEVVMAGLTPDLVYIDAAHDAESVRLDVYASAMAFPDAILVGDDWDVDADHYGVASGVADGLSQAFASYDLRNNGKAWWAKRVP